MKPLTGLQVLELGQYIAGPGVAMILGDLGAQVIKIEAPGGDPVRRLGAYGKAMLCGYNRGKKSVELDLRSENGKAAMRRLLAETDVLVENLRPHALDRLGLSKATRKNINPRLINLSISGFPATSRSSERSGYDIVAQAESGLMSVTGDADGLPQRVGVPIIDTATAHIGAEAVLAALLERGRTGVGKNLRISLLEVALNLQLPLWFQFLDGGPLPKRYGLGQPTLAPAAEVIKVADGYVIISAYTEVHWRLLCKAIQRGELGEDIRFNTLANRVANREELRRELSTSLSLWTVQRCLDVCTNAGIVCGSINNYKQAKERGILDGTTMVINTVDKTGKSAYRTFGLPYEDEEEVVKDRGITRCAPELGADTDSVVNGLLK